MAQVFSYKFCEISKKTFFTEHLWTTAYVFLNKTSWKSLCQKYIWITFHSRAKNKNDQVMINPELKLKNHRYSHTITRRKWKEFNKWNYIYIYKSLISIHFYISWLKHSWAWANQSLNKGSDILFTIKH